MRCVICGGPVHRDCDEMVTYCPAVEIERGTEPVYLRELSR